MLRINNLVSLGNGGGDFTPPAIISASTYTTDGGQVLAFTIETDEAATIAISGADAAEVELASNTFTTTKTLRWASNGTRSFGTPLDADSNNVYEITLTPTDVVGNVGTPQNLSITVDRDWVDSFATTFTGETSAAWGQRTVRQIIPAASLSTSGSYVRVVMECPLLNLGPDVDALYIGEKAGSGDAYDMASSPTPVQLTVGGSTSFSLPQNGGEIKTDGATFAIDETKSYILSAHFSNGTFIGVNLRSVTGISGADMHYKAGVSEAATANVSGYTNSSATRLFKKVQVA